MKILVSSHNFLHPKCNIGTKISNICGGRLLEYNQSYSILTQVFTLMFTVNETLKICAGDYEFSEKC